MLRARSTVCSHHTVIVLFLIAALFFIVGLSSCAAVEDESPDAKPVQEPAPTQVAHPLASFARMEAGEWRMTFSSGTSMFDIWNWGPGQHSMLAQTYGSGAAGEPWRALQVFYWHPGRKQVCLLALSPFARGVSEGTMRFEGEAADAAFDLYQTGGRRVMGLRWTFHGTDQYHETLLEDSGAGLRPLNELDCVRSQELTQEPPRTAVEAAKPSKYLQVLESFLGHTWEARGDGTNRDAFHIQSTFEYVPYADAIYAHTVALTPDGEATGLLDAYLYHHTGTDALRCLALSKWGGVYEGEWTVLEGGALQLDLKNCEGDQVGSHLVRFDFEKDGTLRDRVWSQDGNERTLLLDVYHEKLESKKD